MNPLGGLLDLVSPVIPGRDGTVRPTAEEVDGYFPADSMVRRLHRERIVAISGVRALLMQALDPLAVVGFDRHSVLFEDPEARLVSTDRMMSRIYFGTRETALATGRAIEGMHDRVNGMVEEDYGPIPAGTPYSAGDPELMLWTLATLADSAMLYASRFISPLSDEEREAYWSDYRQVGQLLGMPDDSMPPTEPELREYLDGRLRDGSLYISDEVRERAVAIIFDPPFSGWTRLALTPLTEAVKLSSVGLLPPEARQLYGFGWDPIRQAALDSLLLQVRLASPTWPSWFRLHDAARAPAGTTYQGRVSIESTDGPGAP